MGSRADLKGLLLVDKERGPTSHDVVAALRRLLGIRRIGHCGTLDPLATGLMVLCVGNYTRLNPWLTAADKQYRAAITLGATSNTDDAEGQITQTDFRGSISPIAVEECIEGFLGEIEQVPPAFSAVKVAGVRSHKLARSGREAALQARTVCINTFRVLDYDYPKLDVAVHCSKGTYIRSLARDLGEKLGCGAHLSGLRRTAVGSMSVDDALTLTQVEDYVNRGMLADHFYCTRKALGAVEHIELSGESDLLRFEHGNAVAVKSKKDGGECAVFDGHGALYGMGRLKEGYVQPMVVLHSAPMAEGGR